MGFLDQLFNQKRLTLLFFMCTTNEALNLGSFMYEVLKDLNRWHSDKGIFEKEAYGPKRDWPGFCKKLGDDKSTYVFLEYEDFRRLLLKWHQNVHNALKTCLTGGEFMHMRNAITILRTIVQIFPIINFMGKSLLNIMSDLRKEEREDLKLAATSLFVTLKRRENEWVVPQAFYLVSTTF